ncbi:unnamed protein product [Moneuplotes crassus]|uniref:Uncharacterized protein n=1 Tax=Euplotes crassus TaxID=5936 RepID=A0AAD1U444_EUPCR|nr:unnamed protein product [Moneuplotes crassus]
MKDFLAKTQERSKNNSSHKKYARTSRRNSKAKGKKVASDLEIFFGAPKLEPEKKPNKPDLDQNVSNDSYNSNLAQKKKLIEPKPKRSDMEKLLTQMAQKTKVFNKLFKSRVPFFLRSEEHKSPEEPQEAPNTRSSQRSSIKAGRRKTNMSCQLSGFRKSMGHKSITELDIFTSPRGFHEGGFNKPTKKSKRNSGLCSENSISECSSYNESSPTKRAQIGLPIFEEKECNFNTNLTRMMQNKNDSISESSKNIQELSHQNSMTKCNNIINIKTTFDRIKGVYINTDKECKIQKAMNTMDARIGQSSNFKSKFPKQKHPKLNISSSGPVKLPQTQLSLSLKNLSPKNPILISVLLQDTPSNLNLSKKLKKKYQKTAKKIAENPRILHQQNLLKILHQKSSKKTFGQISKISAGRNPFVLPPKKFMSSHSRTQSLNQKTTLPTLPSVWPASGKLKLARSRKELKKRKLPFVQKQVVTESCEEHALIAAFGSFDRDLGTKEGDQCGHKVIGMKSKKSYVKLGKKKGVTSRKLKLKASK